MQAFAPGGAYSGGEPAEHAVFAVDGVEHLHGDTQGCGYFPLIYRTCVLVVFGGCTGGFTLFAFEVAERRRGCGCVNTEFHDSRLACAQQRKHTVGADAADAV